MIIQALTEQLSQNGMLNPVMSVVWRGGIHLYWHARNQTMKHNPRGFFNLLRLIGLTMLTGVVYVLLKIQGKLKM